MRTPHEAAPLGLLSLGSFLDARGFDDAQSVADAMRNACRCVSFWFWTDEWDAETSKLRERAEEYLPRATRWLGEHSSHPWQRPIVDQRQMWVGALGVNPDQSLLEPAAGYYGIGYYKPGRGGLWTSTEVQGMPPPHLADRPGWPQHVWGVHPASDARVYEIETSDDWRTLVETYPNLAEREPFTSSTSPVVIAAPFYLPAWDAVAADWDAVRFTMTGKLETIFNLLPVHDGYTFVIDERGTEETLWLRWAFEAFDDEGVVPGQPIRDREMFAYQGPQGTWPAQLEALERAGWKQVPTDGDPAYANLVNPEGRYVLLQRVS